MSHPGKGKLKVYLGYAAGVGKTYRMLEDARELKSGGADIVIGYFEPHGRLETIAKTEGFESVPRRGVSYANSKFEEMDTDAILRRSPAIAIVDEFAHTNVPGSERAKRWEDVQALLDAGIDVLTTMNVQHLESLNDQVFTFTGVRVRETVPDWVIDEADELVFVDLTPRALRNRLERGVVYPPEKALKAMENFFTEGNLSALREMAMRHTAHEVEEKLDTHPKPVEGARDEDTRRDERILICLTGNPSSAMLIRRARRVADYLQAECLAIHVTGDTAVTEAVERHLSFARNLRIEAHKVKAEDVADAIDKFARERRITQIFMGRSAPRPWWMRFQETTVQRVVKYARNMQVTIVAQCRR